MEFAGSVGPAAQHLVKVTAEIVVLQEVSCQDNEIEPTLDGKDRENESDQDCVQSRGRKKQKCWRSCDMVKAKL